MPRKKPYSGKQKRFQLQEKRDRKAGVSDRTQHEKRGKSSEDNINVKKRQKGEYDPKRYNLNFHRESREEIERRKKESQTVPIKFVDERELEVDIKDIYQPGSVLDMPKRPCWNYGMSKQQLEQKEEAYFKDYLSKIYDGFGEKSLSYFEHNLETWRQAWRVIEMCNIIVMVTDVRHPVLHFSPALYKHVVEELKKPLILVLNKIDLVPASVIAAWTSYFKELFPSLHVVWFTSFPQDSRQIDHVTKLRTKRRPPRKRVYTTQIGPRDLLSTCKDIFGSEVDLSSWEEKIERDMKKLGCDSRDHSPIHIPAGGDAALDGHSASDDEFDPSNGDDDSFHDLKLEDGVLTIGFVGHPNVGKSSLMNGLIGRKVVSTSVTPGHTKYFQTYFLTKTVKLCDSPGLVFPSLIPKQLQILSGIYPIAQVQEPYTPVGFLAARIPLVELLKVEYPKQLTQPFAGYWTPWDVCEGWADKRNYKTAKAARPDVYRAANSILRMTVDGRLCLYMRPPGFFDKKGKLPQLQLNDSCIVVFQEYWVHHEMTSKLLHLQESSKDKRSSMGEASLPVLNEAGSNFLSASDVLDDSSSEEDSRVRSRDSSSEGDDEFKSKIDFESDALLHADTADSMFNKFALLDSLKDEN